MIENTETILKLKLRQITPQINKRIMKKKRNIEGREENCFK